jgi:hypothetical protein
MLCNKWGEKIGKQEKCGDENRENHSSDQFSNIKLDYEENFRKIFQEIQENRKVQYFRISPILRR